MPKRFIKVRKYNKWPRHEWLQRHLGNEYQIHLIESRDREAMHMETSWMSLAPGKVLVNPGFLNPEKLPDVFKTWDVLIAPDPVYTSPSLGQDAVSWRVGRYGALLDTPKVMLYMLLAGSRGLP